MVLGLHKRGIGIFTKREDTESALNQLKNANFPIEKVSVVGKDVSQGHEIASLQNKFSRHKTVEGLQKGAVVGGTLGAIGGLLAGFSTLMLPEVDSIVLTGAKAVLGAIFAGGFVGTAAGGLIGAVIGNGVSEEHAKAYSDRIAKGDYLVMVDGTNDEIHQAESILRAQGIQDWGVYTTT